MADQDKIETRYNYFWIHNVFGHFIKDTMDYFAEYLYPRFSPWKVIGTFDKAVEFINKKGLMNREADQPLRPALILDPSGDFGLDENYGKMLYRFPNLAPGWIKYVYEPIYQDEHMLVTVAFGRFVGELNFLSLLSSFYEYTDMKVFLNLIFGGQDRFIFPRYFSSFIILPPELYNYRYTNPITGVNYQINFEAAYNTLVRTTNTHEVVYPCTIRPRYKLTNMSDSSTRWGGTDNLPDWKLSFTLSYEIELPTYIVLQSDYLAKKLQINIGYGSCYSANSEYMTNQVPDTISTSEATINLGLDSTSNTTIIFPTETTINKNIKPKMFKTRYYHVVTKDEADATNYFEIIIPEPITDYDLFKLNGKNGILSYWDHYKIIDQTTLRVDKTVVTLEEDEILELYIYTYI